MQIKKIAVVAALVALTYALNGCATNSNALPEADCTVLNSFSSNKKFPPWTIFDERDAAIAVIKQDQKDKKTSSDPGYYKIWLSNVDDAVDVDLRKIEGDAGRASAGLDEGEIKSALVAVAGNASEGSLGILEGLSVRCLAN